VHVPLAGSSTRELSLVTPARQRTFTSHVSCCAK
jgi:hypothetical protein